MLQANGFIDWADTSIAGHPLKVYTARNTCKGFACHSVAGDLAGHKVPDRFLSDDRVPGKPNWFTDYAAASVQFILYRDGHLRQLYPITASTWTSGGPEANTSTMSMEAEGGYSPTTEKLTVAAEDTFIRLLRDLEPVMGVPVVGRNLWQHKDLCALYGYPGTACASDRYSNAWARVTAIPTINHKDDSMTPAERTLTCLAWGEYATSKAVYRALVSASLIPEAQLGGPVDMDADDVNSAMSRRMRIAWVAGANPEAAYNVIK